MKKSLIKYRLRLFVFFCIISVIYIWSFAHLRIVFGSGDLMFQANRIEELYQDVIHGVFVPRISTYTFNQVGSGINFFYPWILLYPFVIFRLITHNPISAFYLGIFLETLVTLLISYYAMGKYSSSKKRAIIFAITYTLANYRLYLVFNQNVLAESIAYTFLPLILLGFYEVFYRNIKSWSVLAIGMTMLLYSHMLTTALTALFMLGTLVITWRKISNKKLRLLAGIKAAILSFLLSAFYLVPFFEQTVSNHLTASWVGLLFIKTPMETITSSINNEPTQVVGLLLIIVLIFGFFFWKRANTVDRYAYLSGLILVTLTTTLFPWAKLLNTPVANLQFPYRLTGLATLMLAIYLSAIVTCLVDSLQINYGVSKVGLIVIFSLLSIGLTYSAEQQILAQRINIPMLNRIPTPSHYYPEEHGKGYNLTSNNWDNMFHYYRHNGSFDYFPVTINGDNVTDLVTHHAFINGRKVAFASRLKSKPNEITYNLSGIKSGAVVELPILYYHNDRVKIGNSNYSSPNVTKKTTVQVKVPRKGKTVSLKYFNSKLDNGSMLISILTWISLIIIYVKYKLSGKKG
ncbi:hypothetical protein L2520_08225 [Limosilactobacillus vaginalis]|uniref:Membrane protein 6-pyruvoyl-tetrahydropterin synthase-related domain-containing protein n=1 Tax=Limosilactobacillus vaginalis TaxID=1633 RepID=A0ABT4K8X3_9LACO|nr:6-pyruvoyl-tetrahydropterin synthase-related protein [Limosilactobacillus vaginalis]MCZ3747373.1 hypothetical protein [Limosilactobacillus vaginalis]MCZ3752356.1 hypothetical protein [Limosilactobacillus vaginalis]MCZ3754079.1 hypothetical protein [Limosilactobacillus vaginalis]MCZ3755780.1 hypothetical protein [Limosilactobacillus vaginalis]MCZ3757526.1 hypothetical protein [Limosilactobacillus vaginalis]